MDQILFVIFGHGVEDQIDAEVKRVPALFLSAWGAGVGPFTQLVALPGASQIVLTIDHGSGTADRQSVQVGLTILTPPMRRSR